MNQTASPSPSFDPTALPPLPDSPLLAGIARPLAQCLLAQLHPALRRYDRGEALVLAGYENTRIGMVLAGQIEAVRTAPDGEQLIMAHMGPGGIFGDVLSGSHGHKSPVTVLAAAPVTALWLPCDAVLAGPSDTALRPAHLQLLRNWVGLLADKYFALDAHIELLTIKSLRARVLRYVAGLVPDSAGWVTLPPTRTRMADYLGCNRSALSRELSRMQQEGLLELSGRKARALAPL